MIFYNNSRKSSTNKSLILNKSLLQAKPELSSSISELLSSDEEQIDDQNSTPERKKALGKKNKNFLNLLLPITPQESNSPERKIGNKTQILNEKLEEGRNLKQSRSREEKGFKKMYDGIVNYGVLRKKLNHLQMKDASNLSNYNNGNNLNRSNGEVNLNHSTKNMNNLSMFTSNSNFSSTLRKFKEFMLKKQGGKANGSVTSNCISNEDQVKKNHCLQMENFQLKKSREQDRAKLNKIAELLQNNMERSVERSIPKKVLLVDFYSQIFNFYIGV